MITSKIVVFQDNNLEKKVFIFKMSMDGERSIFDLVKQM